MKERTFTKYYINKFKNIIKLSPFPVGKCKVRNIDWIADKDIQMFLKSSDSDYNIGVTKLGFDFILTNIRNNIDACLIREVINSIESCTNIVTLNTKQFTSSIDDCGFDIPLNHLINSIDNFQRANILYKTTCFDNNFFTLIVNHEFIFKGNIDIFNYIYKCLYKNEKPTYTNNREAVVI